jgi:hypothetical protein
VVGRFGGPEFTEAQRVAEDTEDQAAVCGVQRADASAAGAEGNGEPFRVR